MSAPQRTPLSWPAHRPRTPAHRRQNGKFKQGGGAITVAGTMDRVEAEIQVAQNIAAVAAHLDATRAITRHGVASAAETLQAFSALPPPSAARSCWQILGLTRDAVMALPANVRAAAISEAWRSLSRETHPDAGVGEAAQAELNVARAEALKEITP